MTFSVDIKWQRGQFDLDVAFDTGPGVTALFGRSGSGKTTILRSVAGLETPTHSRISISGRSVSQPNESPLSVAERDVGFVFQEPRLFPFATVAQNMEFPRRFGKTVDGQKVRFLVDLLDLGDLLSRFPKQISGGQAQRVAIARALLSSPSALCMDEPLSSLDAQNKGVILPYLERLKSEFDLPILYVTHDISEAARLADYLVLIDAGQAQASGPIWDVLSDPRHVQAIGLKASGTVVKARAKKVDQVAQLTTYAFDGGDLILPGVSKPKEAQARLRIAAQDIILATERPQGISALNVLKGTVLDVFPGKGPGVMVQFGVGNTKFLSRVTKASWGEMKLEKGSPVFAIIKASAFDPLAGL